MDIQKPKTLTGWRTFFLMVSLVLIFVALSGRLIPEKLIPEKKAKKPFMVVEKTEWGAWVRLRGDEIKGVNSEVVLQPGDSARVIWEGGKITYYNRQAKMTQSWKVWGANSYNRKYRNDFRFSHIPGVPSVGVVVILGEIENPQQVEYFPRGQIDVLVINRSNRSLSVRLYYHIMIWAHDRCGLDGSFAKFKIYRSN